jgi:RNA polymerase sigma-70 factor (ECF subfamily)
MTMTDRAALSAAESFTAFVAEVEPRLRHALTAAVGRERGREAAAEALAYGWEHWERIRQMENPAGYLYRVGRSRARNRRLRTRFEAAAAARIPEVEPALLQAVRRLSERQRTAVFLVHGMQWRRSEVADLLGISPTAVGTHLERGLAKLRALMGVNVDG